MRGRGRIRYRVRCRDARLFFWADGAISSIELAKPQKAATHVATSGVSVVGLDSSGTRVVWTQSYSEQPGQNGVFIANRHGSSPRQLYASPSQFASNDGVLVGRQYYWLEGDAIARVDIKSGAVDPSYIALPPGDFEGLGSAEGLTADRRYLYFASCGNNAIGRVAITGSPVDKYFVNVGYCVQDVAVNTSHLYWPNLATGSDPSDPPAIGRAGIDGTSVEPFWRLTPGGGELGNYGVAADDRHIYWRSGDSNAGGGKGYVGRIRTDGTGLTPKLIVRQALSTELSIAP